LQQQEEMMKNPAEKKSDRLLEIEQLLLSHPEGLTQAEIARRLGVNRSTVNRYLPHLPGSVYVDDLDGGKWKIDRQGYLVNVRFTLDEAMAVHLATRLLATRLERQNPHAAAALRKLGCALERLAPRISRHLLQSADMMDDPAQRQDPNFLRSLETLTQAWAQQQKVKLWHRKENGVVNEFIFCPYFIEPYAVGQAVHVIGWRQPPNALRTLKIERIERVELQRESYLIPADFNPAELLKDAWGIWYTEDEPVEVILKFGPRVAQRVGETRWHRSEQVALQPDGSLLWQARIAEPKEMLPWVRGWGADVEVLAPAELRERLKEEARSLASLYEIPIIKAKPELDI
jgi:CRISPR-associated endonuclease/helicase Cas3